MVDELAEYWREVKAIKNLFPLCARTIQRFIREATPFIEALLSDQPKLGK